MDLIVLEEIFKADGQLSGEKVTQVNPVSGGCIHNAWQLKLATGQQLFAKTSSLQNFRMLQFEAEGLSALNERVNQDLLLVPKPLSVQKLTTTSILLMPWFDLKQGHEFNLGKGLALLHKESSLENQSLFGWGNDGFIGLNPQMKGWEKSWGECFVKHRLKPQIAMAQKWGLQLNLEKFSSGIINFLDQHDPLPSLVHGDLWKGNASVTIKDKGVIFDPAIWWADREVDIAMTKLFNGFSNEFYSSYEDIWPLKNGFAKRADIYNLYHVLNHANLFGGSYKNQSLSLINKINESLGNY